MFFDNTFLQVMDTTHQYYTDEALLSFGLLAFDVERKRYGMSDSRTVFLMYKLGQLYRSLSTEEEDPKEKEKYYNNSLKWFRQYKYYNEGQYSFEIPFSQRELFRYQWKIDSIDNHLKFAIAFAIGDFSPEPIRELYENNKSSLGDDSHGTVGAGMAYAWRLLPTEESNKLCEQYRTALNVAETVAKGAVSFGDETEIKKPFFMTK
jgi:hypothetical protein